ncbi:hypothetical protein DCAR_0102751 [Daucus carota subsp. sativus]|uniref:Uncharacterized protein n=1 Tax=Daucus carota subsp. sativus TaxID=79200 RepID=A0A166H989_DAUCS|nr:PREDICTED: deacetylvindoline O-acetyltransferase-like [Daucus carota subsp. sativus]WOG83574.1 hypothetical protein DCAR_0102751 [Daucus carota subsp. sativus]
MAFRGLIRSLITKRQLHVVSKSSSNIKPASPTPSKLKQYNIPLHDRTIPNIHVPMILFYPSYNSDHSLKLIPNNASLSDLLKNSLSETLSMYYPFAGRLRSGSYIDCNDEGVHFVEAQIGCKLWEVLEKPPVMEEEEGLGHLFPPCTIWKNCTEMYPGIVMHIQLNHFTCGGIAIAATLHHHIGDALTLCSFLKYWATLSLHSGDHQKLLHLRPHLVHELLPASSDGDSIPDFPLPEKNWTTKEVIFQNTNLAKLKAAVENEDKVDGIVENQIYTRNELLTALLYRCLVAAAAETNTGAHNGSVLIRSVNVRPMIDPPLPETSVGNFVVINSITTSTESDTKYRTLVARMRQEKRRLSGIKNFDGQGLVPKMVELSKNKYRIFMITSMCNFPLYEATNFGWGKPIKALLVDTGMADIITLMDTTNDGIRAVVALGEQDMKNFLAQKELLTYASLE